MPRLHSRQISHRRVAAPSQRRHFNPVKLSIAIWAIITFLALFIWLLTALLRPNFHLLVSPSVAHIEINGEEITNGDYRFADGTFFIRATMDGFETYENEIKVKGDTKFYVAMTPLPGNSDWYLNHPEEQMLLNTIGDYEASKKSQTYADKDTIFAYTPYYDEKNRFQVFVDTGADDILITVKLNTCAADAATYYKQLFHNWLKDTVKVKAEEYNIKYVGLCD